MNKSKNILLIITGGIAAYKSLDLIRRLKEQDYNINCILTESGKNFVTPLSIESLSGNKVYSELFNLTDEKEMGHIQLSRMSDLILVAPATANIMSKMAYGICDDLASTVLMATNKPVMLAPSMNVRMWLNKSTQRNINTLKTDGIKFIGPENGEMACGEYGEGRLSDVGEIINHVKDFFENLHFKPLKDFTALVTSGPTREYIDPVRYISNESSGKQGIAIANRLQNLGAKTTLITGPTNQDDAQVSKIYKVTSAHEMFNACKEMLPVDIAICAAAVADYSVKNQSLDKIKKTSFEKDLKLSENPDILKFISQKRNTRPKLVVGFAAETNDLEKNALKKLSEKGCDWILANDIGKDDIIGGDQNRIRFISQNKNEQWPMTSKDQVANILSSKIINYFTN